MGNDYWDRKSAFSRRVSRRAALRGGVFGAAGLSAAFIAACGGNSKNNATKSTSQSVAPAASATPAAKIKRGGKLTFSQPENFATFDPQYSSNFFDFSLVFDSLLGLDEKGIAGVTDTSLAQAVEQPDPTTFIFHLRKGVKFQDDTDFNAGAVKFSLDRVVAPTPPGQYWKSAFVNYDRVEAPDNFTARLTLKQTDGAINTLLGDAAGIMISPTAYQGKALEDVAWAPVGTGPYRLVDHRQDAYRRYEPFAGHWRKLADGGTAALLDSVQCNEIAEVASRTASLQSGELDLMVTTSENPAPGVLDNDPNLKAYSRDGYGLQFLLVNHALPPMDNADFRRGIAWAIDRETLAASLYQKVYNGKVYSFLSPASWAYKEATNFPAYDVQKAQMFIDRSGIPEAQRTVMLTTANTQLFAAFQTIFARIGVKVVFVDATHAQGKVYKNRGDKPEIHLADQSLTNKVDPHLSCAQHLSSTGPWNMSGTPAGQMDDLITRATSTYDVSARKAIYGQIQDIQADQIYTMIPLAVKPVRQWAKKNVTGIQFRPSSEWPTFRDLGLT